MKRTISLVSFVCLFVWTTPVSVCLSQEPDQANVSAGTPPKTGQAETEANATPAEQARAPWLSRPADLYTMFTTLDEAPLELGAANDRVRELQASLNRELRDQRVSLGDSVYVGEALDTSKGSGLFIGFVFRDSHSRAASGRHGQREIEPPRDRFDPALVTKRTSSKCREPNGIQFPFRRTR